MLYAIIKQACTRLSTCGSSTAQTKQLCDLYGRIPTTPPVCPAAARCLRSIDEAECDTMTGNPTDLWQMKDKLTDCVDAMSC
jgi:hypothetical protein